MKRSPKLYIRLFTAIGAAGLALAVFMMDGPRWVEFAVGFAFALLIAALYLLLTEDMKDDDANKSGDDRPIQLGLDPDSRH